MTTTTSNAEPILGLPLASPSRARFQILLVDDDPDDVALTLEALKRSKLLADISVAGDGIEAMDFLKQRGQFENARRPDLILLDLNMPRMDGHETLTRIKKDPSLLKIPVIVLTTSQAQKDITQSYSEHANAYVTKPVDLRQFEKIVQNIDCFWFTIVTLPRE